MPLRNSVRILLIGLALGWAFDLLFYGKQPGISVLIFASLLTIALLAALRAENTEIDKDNLWLFALLFFFASMVFIRANTFITLLNFSAVLVVIALLSVQTLSSSVRTLPATSNKEISHFPPLAQILR